MSNRCCFGFDHETVESHQVTHVLMKACLASLELDVVFGCELDEVSFPGVASDLGAFAS